MCLVTNSFFLFLANKAKANKQRKDKHSKRCSVNRSKDVASTLENRREQNRQMLDHGNITHVDFQLEEEAIQEEVTANRAQAPKGKSKVVKVQNLGKGLFAGKMDQARLFDFKSINNCLKGLSEDTIKYLKSEKFSCEAEVDNLVDRIFNFYYNYFFELPTDFPTAISFLLCYLFPCLVDSNGVGYVSCFRA